MIFFPIASFCLYLILMAFHGREWLSGQPKSNPPRAITLVAFLALVMYAISVFNGIFTSKGLDLGFFPIANLIAWFVVLTAQVASLRMPVDKLLPPMYVLALINLGINIVLPAEVAPQGLNQPASIGLATHIIASILAYSVITLAACQAVALWLQNHALKARRVSGLIDWLPPLQTMEQLLFQMAAAGLVLLTVSIASGALFLNDIFAQHLLHKTFFSLGAWLIFAILLGGRYQRGWRGNIAIHWTLGGFVALMLAYFGSKFVLEVLLGR